MANWLDGNKNRKELEVLQEKRSTLIIDVTINGRHKNTYQRKLKRINKDIEKLYYGGL